MRWACGRSFSFKIAKPENIPGLFYRLRPEIGLLLFFGISGGGVTDRLGQTDTRFGARSCGNGPNPDSA